MSTVTKAANAHTTVVTGWTNPDRAYATTNDSSYATLVCPKSSTNSGDFGFPAFTTAEIPAHSTLTSVVFFTTYGLTAAVTGGLVGEQARRNSTGATLGTEITRALASMADANGTATGATLTDLRTANELRVRARASKGNTNNASTAQIDRLYLVVTFTETVSAAAGTLTLAATLTEAGRKAISKALGSFGPPPTLAEAGTKATSGAGGTLSVAQTLSLSGTKQESESHSGAGSMTFSATIAAAGAKATSDAGTLTLIPALEARAAGIGLLTLDPTIAAEGAMGGIGGATLTTSATLAVAGTKATSGAAGTLTLTESMASDGVAYSSARAGTGSLPASATFGLVGSKATSGGGTLALLPTMAASGPSAEAVPIAFGGHRAVVRPALRPVRRAGHGTLVMFPRLFAAGVKTAESDDELVLALIA